MIKYRAYNYVSGSFDYFTLQEALISDNSKIGEKSISEDFSYDQSTSLLDKNGVDIYENDICMVDGLGASVVKISPLLGVYFDNTQYEYPIADCIAENDTYEVIGNVHTGVK